jgi:hypothetical protein
MHDTFVFVSYSIAALALCLIFAKPSPDVLQFKTGAAKACEPTKNIPIKNTFFIISSELVVEIENNALRYNSQKFLN